jgi:hypothetical protein
MLSARTRSAFGNIYGIIGRLQRATIAHAGSQIRRSCSGNRLVTDQLGALDCGLLIIHSGYARCAARRSIILEQLHCSLSAVGFRWSNTEMELLYKLSGWRET